MENLFKNRLDLSGWERYKVRNNREYRGVSIPNLRQEVYQKTIDNIIFSVGVFYYKNSLAYIAWGLKNEAHCSFHATVSPDGKTLEQRKGCPEVTPTTDKFGLVTGFILDKENVFGTGAVSNGIKGRIFQKFKRLLPLLTLLLLVFIWATYRSWPISSLEHLFHDWMLDFMAGFFILFGGLKVINIKNFAKMYGGYDIVAKRFPLWGYFYAPLEVFLGILYFNRTELFIASVITIILMSVASVGVYYKLSEKEETACACLGGFFNVPVTWLTFAENILMVIMATMFIFYN